jgi:hypothetical protein
LSELFKHTPQPLPLSSSSEKTGNNNSPNSSSSCSSGIVSTLADPSQPAGEGKDEGQDAVPATISEATTLQAALSRVEDVAKRLNSKMTEHDLRNKVVWRITRTKIDFVLLLWRSSCFSHSNLFLLFILFIIIAVFFIAVPFTAAVAFSLSQIRILSATWGVDFQKTSTSTSTSTSTASAAAAAGGEGSPHGGAASSSSLSTRQRRRLLRDSPLTKTDRHGRPASYHFILFNDLFVFGAAQVKLNLFQKV